MFGEHFVRETIFAENFSPEKFLPKKHWVNKFKPKLFRQQFFRRTTFRQKFNEANVRRKNFCRKMFRQNSANKIWPTFLSAKMFHPNKNRRNIFRRKMFGQFFFRRKILSNNSPIFFAEYFLGEKCSAKKMFKQIKNSPKTKSPRNNWQKMFLFFWMKICCQKFVAEKLFGNKLLAKMSAKTFSPNKISAQIEIFP